MFGSVMQLGRQHSWQSLTVRDRLGLDAKLEQITGMDDLISDADLMEQGPAPNPAKGKLDSYDFAVLQGHGKMAAGFVTLSGWSW